MQDNYLLDNKCSADNILLATVKINDNHKGDGKVHQGMMGKNVVRIKCIKFFKQKI